VAAAPRGGWLQSGLDAETGEIAVTVRGRTAGLAALAALAIGLTGCTGTADKAADRAAPDPAAAAQIVRAANTKTLAAKSATVDLQYTITSSGQQPIDMTGTGVVDLAGGDSRLAMTVPGLGELELRTVGGTMYLKLPAQFASLSAKPWVRLDAAGTAAAGLGQLSQLSPADQLAYLKGVPDDVTTVGKETVDGTPTTHYRAKLDLDTAAEAMTAEARKGFAEARKTLSTATVPADIWVDERGQLRKFELTLTMTPPKAATPVPGAPTGPLTMLVSQRYSDLGVPVTITAPAAAQSTDMSALTGK
jgi:hypothetical protein